MKIFICLSTLFFILSCGQVDCSGYTKMLSAEECNIVVESQPTNSVWFKLKGYDPNTQKPKICASSNRWWNLYANEIEIGDTIVKRKGELTFTIRKKDTIINHEWKCYEK